MTSSESHSGVSAAAAPQPNDIQLQQPALRIEGDLTIYRTGELKQQLLRLLDGPCPIIIDLSGVTALDSAGLQLLIATKKAADASHKTLDLTSSNPVIDEVVAMLNLTTYFAGPTPAASAL